MNADKFKTQDGYECPTCEKTLPTSLGLKQHHTKTHGESLLDPVTCEWCGDEFIAHGSNKRVTCSRECKANRRGELGMPARKRRTIVQCRRCGDDMEVRDSEVGMKVYCSKECRRGGEDVSCEVCGEEFYAYESYVDSARFCSQECYGVWLSENKSGSDSWHWRGDKRDTDRPGYGPGWTERKREIVRDRDRRRCTECGLPEDTHLANHDMKLHVHHTVNARESSNPAVYNAVRNLRSLCVGCHLSRH